MRKLFLLLLIAHITAQAIAQKAAFQPLAIPFITGKRQVDGKVISNKITGFADTTAILIMGKVTDDQNIGLTGSKLMLYDYAAGTTHWSQTDTSGNFRVNANAGQYILSFSKDPFETIQVDSLKLSSGQIREINVSLGSKFIPEDTSLIYFPRQDQQPFIPEAYDSLLISEKTRKLFWSLPSYNQDSILFFYDHSPISRKNKIKEAELIELMKHPKSCVRMYSRAQLINRKTVQWDIFRSALADTTEWWKFNHHGDWALKTPLDYLIAAIRPESLSEQQRQNLYSFAKKRGESIRRHINQETMRKEYYEPLIRNNCQYLIYRLSWLCLIMHLNDLVNRMQEYP